MAVPIDIVRMPVPPGAVSFAMLCSLCLVQLVQARSHIACIGPHFFLASMFFHSFAAPTISERPGVRTPFCMNVLRAITTPVFNRNRSVHLRYHLAREHKE